MSRARRSLVPLLLAIGVGLAFFAPDPATAQAVLAQSSASKPMATGYPDAVPALPLGPPGTTQTATQRELAPGVRLTTIVAGRASTSDSWALVSLQATQAAADDLAQRVRAQGRVASVQRIDERAGDDPQVGPLGWLVVSRGYRSEADAQQANAALKAAGVVGLGVSNTALFEANATGPWVVRILRVDHRQLRRVHAVLATGVVPGRETTSSLAARLGAVAAVNGGYFVVGAADGVPGDLAGIGVQDGVYDSEAVADRAALVLDAGRSTVASVTTHQRLRSSDGAAIDLNGVDRSVGRIRDCGAPGDQPFERAMQDLTCTNPNEIVAFDSAFGASSQPGPGVAVTLDRAGRVVQAREQRGAAIPASGRVLEGIGAGADWLRGHARVGQRMTVSSAFRADNRPLVLRKATGVVNGGPFLVRGGRPFVDAYRQGFVHPGDPGFYFAFGVARNPRTMAGFDGRGDLFLVSVDGRNPGYSIGMSFAEQSRVMLALGARAALNLDGGGSTTMVAGRRLLGRPSDPTGERPVGDVVAILPTHPPMD